MPKHTLSSPPVLPEFSYPVSVVEIPAGGVSYTLEAGPQERQALARRFDLVSLDCLKGSLKLRKIHGDTMMELSGELEAKAVQRCVVTLEDVPESLKETFTTLFDLSAELADAEGGQEMVLSPCDDEPEAEPLGSDTLDLGEYLAQQFGVSLNPYPRRPDASPEALETPQDQPSYPPGFESADRPAMRKPFAGLADALKNKGKS